jgi:hypothetical protein
MGHRSFAQRREDRRDRLVDRAQYLTNRMCNADISENAKAHVTRERSAILWALEEIDRLTAIEDVLDDAGLNEGAQLAAIDAICESRYRPTDADRERTPQLARQE